MRFTRLLILASLLPVALVGCKHETDFVPEPSISVNCDPDTIYFQNDILPLLLSSCATSGCHDNATAEHGVILTSYSQIMQTGKIKPGDPNDSEIIEVLTKNDPDDIMPPPPKQPLDPALIQMIKTWIQQGAINNRCDSKDCDSLNVTYTSTIQPMMQSHCVGCHSGPTPDGNVKLDSYSAISGYVQSGQFYGSVTHQPGFTAMPYNGNKLSDCQIAQIKKWINDGYPQN